jgi:mannitol-1-phosphate 5-dehydrogenase
LKQAVQFGAGNIGRGFLGQLYHESGYHATYVDVIDHVIDGLNDRGSYPLRLVDNEGEETLLIDNVSAVRATDLPKAAEAIARADIAATAVGVPVLPRVAPVIAAGIEKRFSNPAAPPLNIIVCENMIGAGPFLRERVRECLDTKWHAVLDEKVGFVEASIGRMVPVMTAAQRAEDPLLICVEPFKELPVDENGFRGSIPELAHMHPRKDFGGYVERKLFVHNAGHATTAYFGYLRGHEFIYEAIADPAVREKADAAIAETSEGLVRKHGLDAAELAEHWVDLKHRFANRALADQVARVAKDPIRKLGPQDRLIGAGLMCLEQGVEPKAVAQAAAAALHFDHPDDPAAQELQALKNGKGLGDVLQKVCQLSPESPLARLIYAGIETLKNENWLK